jgi:hypothetical protein
VTLVKVLTGLIPLWMTLVKVVLAGLIPLWVTLAEAEEAEMVVEAELL